MNPNDYRKQRERGLKRKLELIKYKGGECELCHYRKNISALEFHHINATEKEFQLDARHLSNTKIEKLKLEVDKCMLLCANCHRELHHPEFNDTEVQNTLEQYSTRCQTVLGRQGKINTCPVCGTSFKYVKGKKYCSTNCREIAQGKNKYPSLEEVEAMYNELKTWQKVAEAYGLTRKIIQHIRKKK